MAREPQPVRTSLLRIACAALVAVGLGMATPAIVAGRAHADSADVIQSQEMNTPGIVGEIIQAKRKEGVLTIKLRLRNTGAKEAHVKVINGRNFDAYYVTAGNKKYFVLKDTEGVPLAPQVNGGGDVGADLDAGATYTWWAKYPAPPPEVKAISYYTPLSAPFEDIPVTDQ